MKFFLNFLIIGFVFIIASLLFPNTIVIDGFATLLKLTAFYWFMNSLFMIVIFVIIIYTIPIGPRKKHDNAVIICGYTFISCAMYFNLILYESMLPGFTITNVILRMIITIIITILTSNYGIKIAKDKNRFRPRY